ncbi:MAG: 2-oxoacid:acceptor oxidoreductase subunit alpha [Xanthomonadales bacterium]|nr:2-oxoacid:acceptor oxidoreductase subunit alpha [Xanthomonadales bacterium]NIN59707.1 2-oxoacid:acceptor oxidoreductase subunit alpha [Xanthomonadales bacterium]NIN75122.1 2-oxoacid:acceptor oxidoreductase subunit alpha [Xanthomonadales bacterium]NIO15088.1 2-oxoacid:acceptor oxidoreductase subunit alpha [Xanthomonadales bacterium]NIP12100.1 2-oxoacid:acceptor oxidoreductase subunit alpha [Xanthomonadales bacterium]
MSQVLHEIGPMIDPQLLQGRERDDLTMMVAGQGGDGSLTIIALVSRALLGRGYEIYRTSNIASRIKGGHAAAFMRATTTPRSSLGDRIDILVAFDIEAVQKASGRLAADSIIIFDSSRGALPPNLIPDTALLIPVPFSRLAVRDLRRDLFKNSLGFGLMGRIIGLSDEEVEDCLRRHFKKLSKEQFEPNIRALREGQSFADGAGIGAEQSVYRLPDQGPREARTFITGNHAAAMGFLAAGGRFFAGYPITPATDVMNFLARFAPPVGGVIMQAEDELAAINLAIGAALTGVRAMTASSGPGIALMLESIGHCGSAEIPMVIIDCQRAGPSTGMPTKPEQSDVNMLTRSGNGDYPRIVLAPGNVEECFYHGAFATNLSQQAQCPVILALDALCHDSFTAPHFDLDRIQIDNGKRLSADDVAKLDAYRRYEITEDGISPWAVPGTPGAMNLVTGNERNEWGRVSTEPAVRVAMMDKRSRKIATVRPSLPRAHEWGDTDSPIGIIGVGILEGVITESVARLTSEGLSFHCHRPRTLWPVLEDTVAFVKSHERVYIVEQSESGQLADLIRSAGAPAERIRSILKYDGLQYTAEELVAAILAQERAA